MASDPARVANVPGSPRSLLPVTRLGCRALAKTGIAAALHWSGAAHPLSAVAGWQRTPPVITYHRVVADFAAHAQHTVPSMLISSTMLEQHLDWMGRRFRFVSIDELGSHLESGAAFDKPVAAITFDDGYRDVYEHAFPLLKRKGIPAAIFVVTDLVATTNLQLHDTLYLGVARALSAGASGRRGVGRPFGDLDVPGLDVEERNGAGRDPVAVARHLLDRLSQAEVLHVLDTLEARFGRDEREALTDLLPLTWDMLAEMHRDGMTIGSHTKTHALLTNESPQKILDETAGSRRELERRLGIKIDHFSYPAGRFDSRVVSAVAGSGYRFGYTTCRHRDRTRPLLTIPRRVFWQNSCLNAFGRFSSTMMDCQVRGTFDFGARCKREHGRRRSGAS
jgi:peptidoglycan/xylan/chitin deacetylase (PgdA/CDA1 family)